MANVLNLGRENLVSQSKDKKIEEIEIADLKLSLQEVALADIISFTCDAEKKQKTLKHRWSIKVGKINALEL